MTPAVTLVTILDPCTKNLLTMGQGEEMDRLLSAIKDHVESEADSSSTSMAVEDSSAGSHDDESKPISKRCRLLQKHFVEVPLEEAIRAEITSYLQCQADDDMNENPVLFCKTHVQFEHLKKVAKTVLTSSASSVAVKYMFCTMGLILNGKQSMLSGDKANTISFIHDSFAFLDMV